ncbi:MAG: glycosyltransferase family 2 protein [Aphanocapsa feldmannii 277cV]|uniref:Beta-monoglucosyldiacylglycerol synthase n=2 Tax=Aphanocapsa feldmannii TaxID=192050 RepID=A0A524RQM8_9CHRO|nr:MAG: glycosyltransferase family 2 protein [Aphanocapsa feldmannii 277cV]TGH22328.1 MAG: glycosyltransferase family 2 protein [Aphanocapsa feldmannii 277cI]
MEGLAGSKADLVDALEVWEDGRRRKSALFLLTCLGLGAAPHVLHLGPWPALAAALLMAPRLLAAVRVQQHQPGIAQGDADASQRPSLDVLVAARDEVAVVDRLVDNMMALDCSAVDLQLWVVNDASTDGTREALERLSAVHPRLNVLHRQPGEGGGKSGALNALLPGLRGDWLMVLDADAQLAPDLFNRLAPSLRHAPGALQLRKAVLNPDHNLFTRFQALEMAFDAQVQRGRLLNGGVGELRGNGELIRRELLLRCGGFNEGTITDDLDLSFRLHLSGVPIDLIWNPPVCEEAVTGVRALWRQRQRWAEGGLQRFFDYWPALLGRRLQPSRRNDIVTYFVVQYALPMMGIGDLATALVRNALPLMWPFSLLVLLTSSGAIYSALSAPNEGPPLPRPHPLVVVSGLLYLLHWFVVIPLVSFRMALRPKRLVWVKTLHEGLAVSA